MEDKLPNVLVGARFAPDNTRIFEMRTDTVVDLFLRELDMVARVYPAAVEGWNDEDKTRLGVEMLRMQKSKTPKAKEVEDFTRWLTLQSRGNRSSPSIAWETAPILSLCSVVHQTSFITRSSN